MKCSICSIKRRKISAFDSSSEAKKKVKKLDEENGVDLSFILDSFEDILFDENSFDLIALIYAHTNQRQYNHQKLLKSLKLGGILLVEGFSKNQINNTTGGPRNIEMLFSKEKLLDDFNTLPEHEI